MTKLGRKITRFCKQCGEPFKETNKTKECPKCRGKKYQIIAKLAKERDNEEQKEWKNKIIKTTTDQEKKETWTDETYEISTTEKCTTCNDVHFKAEKYDHKFTGKTETECLKLNDVLRLMIEFEQEKEYKNTEVLRYLNRKGLLRE